MGEVHQYSLEMEVLTPFGLGTKSDRVAWQTATDIADRCLLFTRLLRRLDVLR